MHTYARRARKGAGPEMKREQAEGAHPAPPQLRGLQSFSYQLLEATNQSRTSFKASEFCFCRFFEVKSSGLRSTHTHTHK